MSETPLRVWVLSDNQPGHYNLSSGVIAALRRVGPVEERRVVLRLRFGLMRNLLRFFLNRNYNLPASGWMRLFYSRPELPAQPCDLIVSAGGKTSFANAWLGRDLKVPNIFIGSLRRLSPELFTVTLTLEPVTPPSVTNLVLELPPSTIDKAVIDRKAERLRQALKLPDQRLYALLIGGDGAGYKYDKQDWARLGRLLNVLSARYQVRWLLLGSRRTGVEARQVIGSTADSAAIAASAWYEPGEKSKIEAFLGAAEKVFVTEDSMTMVAEAIYSQRPVVSLRPTVVASTKRYATMMKRFADQRWICRYDMSALLETPDQLAEQGCNPLARSPLDELSEQLVRRLQL